MSMKGIHQDALIKHRLTLVRSLEVNEELMSALHEDFIITDDMAQKIMSYQSMATRVGKLLDLLARRGPQAFRIFIKSLVDCHHTYLAQLLDTNMTKEVQEEIRKRDEALSLSFGLSRGSTDHQSINANSSSTTSVITTPVVVHQPHPVSHLPGLSAHSVPVFSHAANNESYSNVQPMDEELSSATETNSSPVKPSSQSLVSGRLDSNGAALGSSFTTPLINARSTTEQSRKSSGTSAQSSIVGNSDISIPFAIGGYSLPSNAMPRNVIVHPELESSMLSLREDVQSESGSSGVTINLSALGTNVGLQRPQHIEGEHSLCTSNEFSSSSGLTNHSSFSTNTLGVGDESLMNAASLTIDPVLLRCLSEEAGKIILAIENSGPSLYHDLIDKLKPSGQVRNGRCLMFSDEKVIDNTQALNLEFLLTKLGFISFISHNVQSCQGLKTAIEREKEYLQSSRGYHDGFALVVLAFGSKGQFRDLPKTFVGDVLDEFSRLHCTTLENKPKLFLFQLCERVPPCEDDTDTGEAELQELTSAISQLTLSNISNMAVFYLESKVYRCRPNLLPWVLIRVFTTIAANDDLKKLFLKARDVLVNCKQITATKYVEVKCDLACGFTLNSV